MPEYIEREKAFKLIKEHKEKETGAFSKGLNKGLRIAMSIIKNPEQLPSVNVIEVSGNKQFDRIKRMSVEEMANFLMDFVTEALTNPKCIVVKNWLESEVENNEG